MAGDDQEYVESGNNSPLHMNDPDYVDVEGVAPEVRFHFINFFLINKIN